MNFKTVWGLLKTAGSEWWEDNAPRLGASLAFYTMLSIAPLLVIVTTIAGLAYGQEAAEGQLVYQMQDMVGPQGAEAVQGMLKNANHPTTGVIASIIGVVILLLGAAGVFVELQSSLDIIWGVTAQAPSGVWGFLRARLLSFLMILVIGFLLLVSLVVTAGLAALGHFLGGSDPTILFQILNLVISLGVMTLLFVLMFKLLPDVKVTWTDVLPGAALTAVLFTIGKFLIGLYLGNSGIGSTYGAAGSLAVFLVWVYYSSQILFFGAEFTQVYTNRFGSRVAEQGAENVAARKEAIRQGAAREKKTVAVGGK